MIRYSTYTYIINCYILSWAQLGDMIDRKRREIEQAHRLQTFKIDCQETITWIQVILVCLISFIPILIS